jgi:hypothetical protein
MATLKRIGVTPTPLRIVKAINPDYDFFQLIFFIVWLTILFILIYVYREKRKKNKYVPPSRDEPIPRVQV